MKANLTQSSKIGLLLIGDTAIVIYSVSTGSLLAIGILLLGGLAALVLTGLFIASIISEYRQPHPIYGLNLLIQIPAAIIGLYTIYNFLGRFLLQ